MSRIVAVSRYVDTSWILGSRKWIQDICSAIVPAAAPGPPSLPSDATPGRLPRLEVRMKTKKNRLVTPEITSETRRTVLRFNSSERHHSIEVEISNASYSSDREPEWQVAINGVENRRAARQLGYSLQSQVKGDHHVFCGVLGDHPDLHHHRRPRMKFTTVEDARVFAEELATRVLTYLARLADAEEQVRQELTA